MVGPGGLEPPTNGSLAPEGRHPLWSADPLFYGLLEPLTSG